MSRQAPTQHAPHPSERWYAWAGGHDGGFFRYYDKPNKKDVDVKLPAQFVVIGKTATIKGWHEPSESGIMANEVSDTTKEPFVVKAFKGGPIAQGFYQEIKDRVNASGGNFHANIYVAFKGEDKQLHIGCVQLKGAALMAWSDFEKKHRKEVWEQAVTVKSFVEGKKGKVVFRSPVFGLVPLSKESDDAAGLLQERLAAYHAEYFKRNTKEQVHAPQPDPEDDGRDLPRAESQPQEPTDEELAEATAHPMDDVPF